MIGLKKALGTGAVLAGTVGLIGSAIPTASASSFPMGNVAVGANTRDLPTTASHSDGTVSGPGVYQSSSVKCWKDGQAVTGAYYTNRWFIVYVTVSPSGKSNWEFVHASYVSNQPSVRECVKGQDY